jgi:hypothetical protein
MKPISPLLIEVAFKQYQEHDGDPHQGYGGGAHRGGGFASVPRVRQGCCCLGDFNVTKQNKQTSFALKDG